MSTQRYSVTPHPIETLLTWVKSEEIAIPEIQRPFVWEATKVRNLLDSLYQGYPVGYLILWRNPTVKLKDGTLVGRQANPHRRPAAGHRADGGPAWPRGADEGLRNGPHSHRVPPTGGAVRGSEPCDSQGWRLDRRRGRGVRAGRQYLPDLINDYAKEPWRRSQDAIFTSTREAPQDHQQPRWGHRAGRRSRHRDRHGDLHPGELGGNRTLAGRLRHVEDCRQRDVRRQSPAQGHRLLLPPCRGPGVSVADREERQGVCGLGVPAADALAEGRQRRHLRPDLHRHAAGGIHVGVRARQAAGPGGVAVRDEISRPSSSRTLLPRSRSAASRRASSPSSTRPISTASR